MANVRQVTAIIRLAILLTAVTATTLVGLTFEHPRLLLLLLASLIMLPFGFGMLYYLLAGARDRDDGIICRQCKGRAFPIDETTRRYRCALCHHQFDGPRHY